MHGTYSNILIITITTLKQITVSPHLSLVEKIDRSETDELYNRFFLTF